MQSNINGEYKESGGSTFLWGFFQDLRFAVRLLFKSPGFTLVAVLTLALGIGANTTMFTLVNAVLFGALPFENSDRIVVIWSNNLSKGRERLGMSFPDFEDFQEQAKSFTGLSLFTFYPMTISDPGRPAEQQPGSRISWNAFSLLGVRPILGRDFLPEDGKVGAPSIAIISHSLWQNRYGGDPDIVGKTIRINESPKAIVGVMPEGMKFPHNEAMWSQINLSQTVRNTRERRGFPVFARLADGVSLAEAQSEVNLLAKRLEQQYPETNQGVGALVQTYNDMFHGGRLRLIFLALLGAVGFVLLIACANVANLLLSRSLTRAREVSIRLALGASRWRIVRQFLIESVLLAFLGGLAGLLLSVWGVWLFLGALPTDYPIPYWVDFSPDYRVFGYLAAICLGTSILFGLAPALRSSKVDLNQTLKEGTRGSVGGRRKFLSGSLVVSEVALALVLLAGAGLMIRSFLEQYQMSSGLENENVLTMQILLFGAKYNPTRPNGPEEIANFYNRLEQQLPTISAAESIAMTSSLPLSWSYDWPAELDGQPAVDPKQSPTVSGVVISPEYFRVLGIPLLRGRAFTERDGMPGQEAAIVNQRLGNKYWPEENPIGKRLRLPREGEEEEQPWLTVVGVAPDVRQKPANEPEIDPLVYVPYRQAPPQRYRVLMARSRVADAHALITPMRAMVEKVNPDITLIDVVTLPEYFARTRWQIRLFGSLFVIFALIGLVLAAVGIYAVMAYSVSQRTQEIGIRMAFGAQPKGILRLVVGQGLKLVLIGVAVGLAGSYAVTRVMASMLVGVSATDTATFAIVAVLLAGVALLASYLPARRAARVDPMLALRTE